MKSNIYLFLVVVLLFLPALSFAQRTIKIARLVNGYWGEWERNYLFVAQGTFDEFVIYMQFDHPSQYVLKVKINGFRNDISKEEKKRKLKEKSYYEYTGSIEFFSELQSDKDRFKRDILDWPPARPRATENRVVSNIRPATIRIYAYKKDPQVYNIYVDGVGLAISFE